MPVRTARACSRRRPPSHRQGEPIRDRRGALDHPARRRDRVRPGRDARRGRGGRSPRGSANGAGGRRPGVAGRCSGRCHGGRRHRGGHLVAAPSARRGHARFRRGAHRGDGRRTIHHERRENGEERERLRRAPAHDRVARHLGGHRQRRVEGATAATGGGHVRRQWERARARGCDPSSGPSGAYRRDARRCSRADRGLARRGRGADGAREQRVRNAAGTGPRCCIPGLGDRRADRGGDLGAPVGASRRAP